MNAKWDGGYCWHASRQTYKARRFAVHVSLTNREGIWTAVVRLDGVIVATDTSVLGARRAVHNAANAARRILMWEQRALVHVNTKEKL